MKSRWGIIDLGTNTFHLLIVEKQADGFVTLFKESRPARIGAGGINRQVITAEALERAMDALSYFRNKLDAFKVSLANTRAFGTSAIRNAENKAEFVTLVNTKTGIEVTVIDGNEEAGYIYKGVNDGVDLGTETSLIMDIGGGSVEFIIANKMQIFWKGSFEIGGQRLMEKFMKKDPMAAPDKTRLYGFLQDNLIPLDNAIHQYAPTKLVGSSGAFDTLVDMDEWHRNSNWPATDQTDFNLDIAAFYRTFASIVHANRAQRLAIPGMIPLRVDMIVVASCMIDFILKTFQIKKIQVSRFSLKEGVLSDLANRQIQ